MGSFNLNYCFFYTNSCSFDTPSGERFKVVFVLFALKNDYFLKSSYFICLSGKEDNLLPLQIVLTVLVVKSKDGFSLDHLFVPVTLKLLQSKSKKGVWLLNFFLL